MREPCDQTVILTPPLRPVPFTGRWSAPAAEVETDEEEEEEVDTEEKTVEQTTAEETTTEEVAESSSAAARCKQSSTRGIAKNYVKKQTISLSKVCLYILQLILYPIYLIFYWIPKHILYFFKFVVFNFVISPAQHVWYIQLPIFRRKITPPLKQALRIIYHCVLLVLMITSVILTFFVVYNFFFLSSADFNESFAIFHHETHQQLQLIGYSYKKPAPTLKKYAKTTTSYNNKHNTKTQTELEQQEKMWTQIIQLENEKIWSEIKRTWSEIHLIDDVLSDHQSQIDSIKQTLENSVFTRDNETGKIGLPPQLYALLQDDTALQENLRNMQTLIEGFITDNVSDYDQDVLNMTETVDNIVKITINKYEEMMDQLIQKAINDYHQDVLNTADFALKSRGGSTIYRLTSPTYFHQPAWVQGLKLFVGIPSVTNPPEIAISSQTNAGECWSMYGSEGTLGVALSEAIVVQGITVDFPSSGVMEGRMGSAPKDIEVFGITSNAYSLLQFNDSLVPLGSIQYDIHSNFTTQTFDIIGSAESFRSVLVRIKSNWGNLEHTDIYRIRIHGTPIA